MRFSALGRTRRNRASLRAGQRRLQRFRDFPGDIALHLKNIIELPIVTLGP